MPFTPLAKEQTEAEAGEGARIPDQGPAGAVPGELPLAEVARIFQGSESRARSRRLTGGASVPPKDITDDELFNMFEMDII